MSPHHAQLHPPEPESEREALFEIYNAVFRHTETLDELLKHVQRQNGRLGRLEKWQAWLTGVLAVVGTLAAAAGLPVLVQLALKGLAVR